MNIENVNSTLLIGDKTDYVSLKLALDYAEQGVRVWYISMKPIENLPENIIQPCREVLQLVTFIYLDTYTDLLKHFNSIHKWKHVPQIIILQDFEMYCQLLEYTYNSMKTAYLCATLLDSSSYIAKKTKEQSHLLICANLESDKLERVQVLYDMYFDNCILKKEFEDNAFLSCIKNGIANKTKVNYNVFYYLAYKY